MTKFLDGPAVGEGLMLKRAPLFLRAVKGPSGKWDALDQLTDTPSADETIVVYRLVNGPWTVHLNMGRKGCGWYQGGEYHVVAEQPSDAEMRTTAAWQTWCRAAVGQAVAADGSFVGPHP